MEKEIKIPVNGITLQGILDIPESARSIVVFSHGSGSSRHSPRNNFVAKVIFDEGIATLLFDLLTEEEDEVYETRFNISLLTERLKAVTDWLMKQEWARSMKIGYFGSSTGAASALEAAAALGNKIKAVVSRGGRPDLAMDSLPDVKSPTLLIVGGWDEPVIEMNEAALAQLNCKKELKIVPEATHLFEEPGKLEAVAKLAKDWFKKYLKN
jgi:putative phosphoribosyl transferase